MGTISDVDWRSIMGQCDIMVRAQGRTSWAYNLLGRSASKHFKASFYTVIKQSLLCRSSCLTSALAMSIMPVIPPTPTTPH